MKVSNLIAFLIKEAQHRIINDERSKNSDHALVANGKKDCKAKPNQKNGGDKGKKGDSEALFYNCKKPGHKKADCWAKNGGKEGQGPGKKKSAKTKTATVAIADNNINKMFTFTCISNYAHVAETL